MEMTEVESSHIEAIGYDSGVQQVRVRFKGGATYVYYDVPANIANNFIEAESVGEYLNEHIKGEYRYEKV
ncbi:hypothetical protein LCGC14_2851170 [marine sediment metagenome]|uniref:KTSC domain-containing protein n=1 Tax=marine sediment metagenome TaxID=412755 RepID=A0A0F8Y8C0_9ZZZZ